MTFDKKAKFYVSKLIMLSLWMASLSATFIKVQSPSPIPLLCNVCLSISKAMAPHSSTLAWKIPWMEEPGGLQSIGSLQVRHDWATSLSLFTFLHWRRKWQPTPEFLPGESQGWGSLLPSMGSHSRTRLKQLSSSSSSKLLPVEHSQSLSLKCYVHTFYSHIFLKCLDLTQTFVLVEEISSVQLLSLWLHGL